MLMAGLLLLSLNVHANGVIAETTNDGGGQIVLTDIPCKTQPNTMIAYSYLKNGRSMLACWASDDKRVFIKWPDDDLTSYPLEIFIPVNKPKNGKWL